LTNTKESINVIIVEEQQPCTWFSANSFNFFTIAIAMVSSLGYPGLKKGTWSIELSLGITSSIESGGQY